jgi:hypothetical protein
VEWRKEDAEAHPVHNLSLPLSFDNPRMDRRFMRGSPDAGLEASIFRPGLCFFVVWPRLTPIQPKGAAAKKRGLAIYRRRQLSCLR